MAKQGRLEGMVPPEIKAVSEKAEILRDVRSERMDLTQREVKAVDDLLKVMREHKIREYRIDNTLFVIEPGKAKVKVKRVSEGNDDEDEGDDEKGDKD